jgi:hypothetical protein
MQERTSRNLKIAGLVVVLPTIWLVVVGIIAIKHHYDYLRYYVGVDQADSFATHVMAFIAVLVLIFLVTGASVGVIALRRVLRRRERAFEVSISNLPLMQQDELRRRRQLKQAAMVAGAAAAGAYGLHRWGEHMDESVRETHERNDRVNELLAEHRHSHDSM